MSVLYLISHSKSRSPTDPAIEKKKQLAESSKCSKVTQSMDVNIHTPEMAYYHQGGQERVNFALLYTLILGTQTGQGHVGNLAIHGREI